MNRIELAALRADDVLGFLAGCGVLCLLSDDLGDRSATLCWPQGAYGPAVVSTSLATDVDELAVLLFGVVDDLRERQRLLPGIEVLPLASGGGDPMNSLSFDDGRGLSLSARDSVSAQRWLASMVGLVVADDTGKLDRSRWWNVGPGPVTIAGTLSKSMEPIVDEDAMRSAFVGWRRHDWVAGYLEQAADIGKERVAGTRSKDAGVKSGVIATTWLALMATRLCADRATGAETHTTVGWSVEERSSVFTYPIWSTGLDLAAIRALLDHPTLARSDPADADLWALSVSELRRSTRLRAGNNNGPMTPARRIWPPTSFKN